MSTTTATALTSNGRPMSFERPPRVLVIDDDTKLCGLLQNFLESDGFHVTLANDGISGLRSAAHADLVVLDMMLPDIDGIAVLSRLREKSMTPVIVLTARGEDDDRILGLEAGADDYLAKPFNARELSARIRAIWRRTRLQLHAAGRAPIRIAGVRLDPAVRKAFVNDKPVLLTTLEFEILEVLMRAAGRVVSRDELALLVYNRAPAKFDRSIDMHISHLRRKIERDRQMIHTVRGSGYQFMGHKAGEP
jgi:two-component system response regulator CpxR